MDPMSTILNFNLLNRETTLEWTELPKYAILQESALFSHSLALMAVVLKIVRGRAGQQQSLLDMLQGPGPDRL